MKLIIVDPEARWKWRSMTDSASPDADYYVGGEGIVGVEVGSE